MAQWYEITLNVFNKVSGSRIFTRSFGTDEFTMKAYATDFVELCKAYKKGCLVEKYNDYTIYREADGENEMIVKRV